MALAALYNRLFQLQDLKRDAELKMDRISLEMSDAAKAYEKLDRFVDTVEELTEIAQDPKHRRYPNITESSKLKLLSQVLVLIRTDRLSQLDITRIERDAASVERMIEAHLNRKS
jgi:hypothetical protein